MINSLKCLGEVYCQINKLDINNPQHFAEIFYEDMQFEKIIEIKIKEINGEYSFNGIELSSNIKHNDEKWKYLLKKGSANSSANIVLSYLQEIKKDSDYDKLKSKFNKSIKEFNSQLNNYKSIKIIGNCIKNNMDNILKDIIEKTKDFKEKGKVLITIKINDMYCGDIQDFLNYFMIRVTGNLNEGDKSIKRSFKGTCSICGKDTTIYNKAIPYKFYTFDQPGFITGGMSKNASSIKASPCCYNCSCYIQAGYHFIEKHSNFNFVGSFTYLNETKPLEYYLIPKLIFRNEELIKMIIQKLKDLNQKKHSQSKQKERAADLEDIYDLCEEVSDYIVFNFHFYKKSNSEHKILLNLHDIYPSIIKRIESAKNNSKTIIETLFRDLNNDYTYKFSIIRDLLINPNDKPKDKESKVRVGHFLKYCSTIFTQDRKINQKELIELFMIKAKKNFHQKDKDYHKYKDSHNISEEDIKKFLILLSFLSNLNLISSNYQEGRKMDIKDKELEKVENWFSNLIENGNHILKTKYAKGIFTLGVLVERFLYEQYQKRETTPFFTKLRGFKLDGKGIRELVTELEVKLRIYEVEGKYRDLKRVMSYYLLSTEEWEKLSISELNYLLCLGMNLSWAYDKDGEKIFSFYKEKQEKEESKNV